MKEFFQNKKALWISVVALATVLALVISALCTEGFGLWRKSVAVSAPLASPVESAPSLKPLSDADSYAHPERLLGAFLQGQDSFPQAAEQAAALGLNALFVPLQEGLALEQAITACHDNGLLCYGLFSVQTPDAPTPDFTQGDTRKALCENLQEILKSHSLDGLLIQNIPHPESFPVDYPRYLSEGGGMGMDTYRQDSLRRCLQDMVTGARILRPNLPVGLLLSGETAAIPPLSDWLNEGMFGFALVQNDFLCDGGEGASFADYATQWKSKITAESISLSTLHPMQEGRQPDELCRQARLCAEQGYHGSVFASLAQLVADVGGETTALTRYLKGESAGSTGANLTLSSPTKTTFTTYESSVAIVGSCDPGFPFTVNGEAVSCNEKGYFSLQPSLSLGENRFVLENKGQTITLNITYRRLLLKEVSPAKPMSVDGSSRIAVSALARRGSRVTATLRSTTVELSLSPGNTDETNSDFATYTGILQMPAATEYDQNMGNITFTATYQGSKETKSGGRITVSKQHIPDQELVLGDFNFDPSLPLGNWGYVAEVRSYQAETFDASLLDDRSRSTNSYLPKGTVDYCSEVEQVYTQNSDVMKYRTLGYGKRVYSYTDNSSGVKGDYLNLYYCQLPTQNSLSVDSVSRTKRHTSLVLNTQWKAPFEVTLTPQSYKNPYPSSGAPDYSVSGTTFTTLNIHFAYSVSGQGAVDMSNDPVFRSGEWVKESDGTYTLRLTLRKAGAFYGWGCNYNTQGQLVFEFLHPYQMKSAENTYGADLSGCVVVLDAGHGGSNPGATAKFGGASYCEDEMNFALVCRVQDELERLGATVVLTRNTDRDLSLYDRAVIERKAKADLVISIHRNSSISSSRHGFESYYYQPYSMAFCRSVNDQAASLFRQNRGIHYITPMYVTRISECPAILIECGYMSNADDMSSMTQDSFDQALAQKITQGIVDHLRSIG